MASKLQWGQVTPQRKVTYSPVAQLVVQQVVTLPPKGLDRSSNLLWGAIMIFGYICFSLVILSIIIYILLLLDDKRRF